MNMLPVGALLDHKDTKCSIPVLTPLWETAPNVEKPAKSLKESVCQQKICKSNTFYEKLWNRTWRVLPITHLSFDTSLDPFCFSFQTLTNARRTTEAAITSAGTRWAPSNAAARKAINYLPMSGHAKVSDGQLSFTQILNVSPSSQYWFYQAQSWWLVITWLGGATGVGNFLHNRIYLYLNPT